MPQRLSEIQPQRTQWLWNRRIPLGGLTVIEGNPGDNKSTLMCDLAARITTGQPMPQRTRSSRPSSVLLLAGEDDADTTVRPRLEAMGANVRRVFVHDKQMQATDPTVLPDGIETIAASIRNHRIRLVVIDPVDPFIAGSVSNGRTVREAFGPLVALAAETRTAIVVVRHLTKNSSGTNVLYQGAGSIALIGLARSALHVARDPSDPRSRLLVHVKANLSVLASTLAFTPTSRNEGLVIDWQGRRNFDARQLQATKGAHDRPALEEAKMLLFALLSGGPAPAKEIIDLAARSGVSVRTLRRAKAEMQVDSNRLGFGVASRLQWELPENNHIVQAFRALEAQREPEEVIVTQIVDVDPPT